MQSRYFTIHEHPKGLPSRELFALEQRELAALDDGEVRIRNSWLSVDPYMRGRMDGVTTYIDPFTLGEPLDGAAVGDIIESRDARFKAGDKVRHMAGWRDIAQLPASRSSRCPPLTCPSRRI